MSSIRFEIEPIAPFSLAFTGWALKRVPIDLIHQWHGDTFQRAFVIDRKPVLVKVRQTSSVLSPKLEVIVEGQRISDAIQPHVEATVARLLGTNIDLAAFYKMAARKNARLSRLATEFRGLKPQRFPSVFEAFVNAVACQQLSLHVGILTLGEIAQHYGASVPGTNAYAFPSPEVLAGATVDEMMRLKLSRNKANYIIGMAKKLSSGELDLEVLSSLPDDALMKALLEIKGIGRWTGEYMMLRGYGKLNSFPIDDSGARAHLIEYLDLDKDTDRDELQSYVDMWKPYSGLLYFHLLMYRLMRKGVLK